MLRRPLLLCLSTCLLGLALPAFAPQPPAWDKSALAEVEAFAKARKTTGLLIIQDRQVVLERNWPLGPDAAAFKANFTGGANAKGALLEDVASLQKSIIALLAAVAIDKGQLDIARPVGAYAGAGWSKATAQQESQITVRHLLEMTSGLTDQLTYQAPAGSRFAYNTPAYALMKPVLEKASGLTLDQMTRRWLTEPLGMADTGWRIRPAAFAEAANPTGLFTSPADLATVGQMVLDKGKNARGVQVIPEAQLNALFQRSAQNPAYGKLWWLNGSAYSIRSGGVRREAPLLSAAPADTIAALGAQQRFLFVVPSRKLVVVRMGQATGEPDFDQQLWVRLARALPKPN